MLSLSTGAPIKIIVSGFGHMPIRLELRRSVHFTQGTEWLLERNDLCLLQICFEFQQVTQG